jgi:AraC-like DNA-binding protein
MHEIPDGSRTLPLVAIDGGITDEPRNRDPEQYSAFRPQSTPILKHVTAFIENRGGGEGLFPTLIEGVNIFRSFETKMPIRQIYRPSLCVVLQGAKEILLGKEKLDYGAMDYLIVSMEVPASGRVVKANKLDPYIGITVDLDVSMLREVVEQLELEDNNSVGSGSCMFVGQVDEALANCIERLFKISQMPKAVPVLYPSLMREICYWLVNGPFGTELCRLTSPEAASERVAKVIHALHTNFSKSMPVEEMAKTASMSISSFHQHFKALTSLTPLQFQKQVRLIEARRLMVVESARVSEAAYKVGYESASQFSREYSRSFGVSPKQDAVNLKRTYSDYMSRKKSYDS